MTSSKIPILLLKTKSTPHDSYEEYFSAPSSLFNPIFVPVLDNKSNVSSLKHIEALLWSGELKTKYGGMIFTSQRAVEGFSQVVQELENEISSEDSAKKNGTLENANLGVGLTQPHPVSSFPSGPSQTFPFYTVGPATSRALTTLLSSSPTVLSPLHPQILGFHTGHGEALAKYILEHYKTIFIPVSQKQATAASSTSNDNSNNGEKDHADPSTSPTPLPPLLFPVGEQRRDIIPKTLMSDSLPASQRIQVDELVVYEAGLMESFPIDLDNALRTCTSQQRDFRSSEQDQQRQEQDEEQAQKKAEIQSVVIVVFSSTGCEPLLQHIGCLGSDSDSHSRPPTVEHTEDSKDTGLTAAATAAEIEYIIATIGPTTYNHLKTKFGFEAQVCAEKPSPQGVGEGVEMFLRKLKERENTSKGMCGNER